MNGAIFTWTDVNNVLEVVKILIPSTAINVSAGREITPTFLQGMDKNWWAYQRQPWQFALIDKKSPANEYFLFPSAYLAFQITDGRDPDYASCQKLN